MGNLVIIGAGKEGKGFAGDEFEKAGWKVTFIDRDPGVVNALKEAGAYEITNYRVDGTSSRMVKNFDVYHTGERAAYLGDVINADTITLCIYPEDMAEAAGYLGPCLAERAKQNPGKKLDILSITNKNHYMDTIETLFLDALGTEGLKQWFHDTVALRDCIIRRGCNAKNPAALQVTATTTMPLLVQSPLYADYAGVDWIEQYDDIEELKDIKIYTYNSPHATTAYAAYIKGIDEINTANKDPEIAKLKDDVLEECKQGILKSGKFSITKEALDKFLDRPVRKERDPELVTRVAIDPIRKLGPGDRLMGPALLCYESGIMPKAIIRSVANGMAYAEPTDPAAIKIQDWIKQDGIIKAVSKVVGLPEDHELVEAIADCYAQLPLK